MPLRNPCREIDARSATASRDSRGVDGKRLLGNCARSGAVDRGGVAHARRRTRAIGVRAVFGVVLFAVVTAAGCEGRNRPSLAARHLGFGSLRSPVRPRRAEER